MTTINKELFHLDIEGLREIISPALPFGHFLGKFLSSHKLSSSLDIIDFLEIPTGGHIFTLAHLHSNNPTNCVKIKIPRFTVSENLGMLIVVIGAGDRNRTGTGV
ncbi:MAG: hypothetical protein WA118_06910 [Carboxydocellales bacterium]